VNRNPEKRSKAFDERERTLQYDAGFVPRLK